MASLDNQQDLVELLDKEKIDYLIITIQRGKENNNANVNLRIPTKNSAGIMLEVLDEVVQHLFAILESKPRKKRKKKK